ncbi:MAG: tetratricopeptide repeat protein [Elusimicrobiaceae bacterium]|nr:tetratricopeptide repeat protein [Elusimicrobiaceae bacterium]
MNRLTAAALNLKPLARRLILSALLAGMVLAVFQPLFNAGFLNLDDPAYVLQNTRIRKLSLENFKTIFSNRDLSLYTPLATLSYTFDYSLGGLNPAIYHITNITLHAANTILVFLLCLALGLPEPAAVLAAAAFGAHPLHVESVAWIAERKDVLYAFFYLSSLLYFLRFRQRGGKTSYALALALFALSALAKPMAVTLPAVLLLCDWFKNGTAQARRNWQATLPFFGLAAGFIALTALPILTHQTDATVQTGLNGITRLLAPPYAWLWYLHKTLWPGSLSGMYVTENAIPAMPAYAIAFLAVWSCLICFLRKNRTIMFGAIFFTVTLLPVIQLVPFGPVLTADRYSYLPALGIFIPLSALAAALIAQAKNRAAALAAVFLVIGWLGYQARQRCFVWRDSLAFWSDTLRRIPPNPIAYANTGIAFMENRRYAEAAAMFGAARKLEPDNPLHAVNLAGALYEQKKYEAAMAVLAQAERTDPACPSVLFNLGRLAGLRGDYPAARSRFTALLANPQYRAMAYAGLGTISLHSGDFPDAVRQYTLSLELDRQNSRTMALLSSACYNAGDTKTARLWLNKAIKSGYSPAETPARILTPSGSGARLQ